MNMSAVKKKAKELGLKCGRLRKAELIRTIQEKEGFEPCYGKSNGGCEYTDCCFMQDCLKVKS